MKKLFIPLFAISTFSFAETMDLTPVELLLADTASQLIYLDKDCNKPIDPQKFRELAKLKAMSEGYFSVEDIDWEKIKLVGNINYGSLKSEYPLSERCEEFREEIRGNYRFLQDTGVSTKLYLE